MPTGHQLVITTIAVLSAVLAPAPPPAAAQTGGDAFEHVHVLAFDAGVRALWLGAHTGLFRSEDQGRTWAKVALPAQHRAPDVLYVGTHEAGVLKTTDAWAASSSTPARRRGSSAAPTASEAGDRWAVCPPAP